MKDQLKESELRWVLSHVTVKMEKSYIEYHPDKIIIEDLKHQKKYQLVLKPI